MQGRSALLLSVSLAKAEPGDPDPASLPPMSLLLSAALSFSPFGAPPPARRDWPPPDCSGSTRRPGSPAPGAPSFAEPRPRGGTEGSPARGEEEPRRAGVRTAARLRLVPASPRHGLCWLERARRGEGGSRRLARCQARWEDTPPLDTEMHTCVHCKILVLQARSMPPCLFSPALCT